MTIGRFARTAWFGKLTLAAGILLAGCATSDKPRSGDDGAGGTLLGSGGYAGTAGANDAGGGAVGASGHPAPAVGGVPQPSGTAGNLTVLNWAGFTAAVSWTFDDSQPSQIAHYPELQDVGVPMTFYFCDGNNALANFDSTWTQAAQDGHEIGNHTAHHCHADLTGCSFGTSSGSQDSEIDPNSSYITQHYPQSAVWTMASPFGDTGWDSPGSMRFFIVRGVGGGMIAPNDSTDPFNLPIYLAQTADTASIFNGETDMAHAGGKWLIFLIHTINPTSDNWYNPVDIADVTGGMSHGKSLPDVWNDTVVNIGAYWRGQKMFSALTPTATGSTTTWTWSLPAHFPAGRYLRVKVDGGTLTQADSPLVWDDHGYYEIALDAGSLTLAP